MRTRPSSPASRLSVSTAERRARRCLELRAATADEKAAGYIGALEGDIPYSSDSALLSKRGRPRPFVEQIAPDAFKRSLAEDKDIMGFAGHTDDPLAAFARVGENLHFTTSASGLHYRALIPDTQAGRDLLALVEKKIIRGTSFEFEVRGEAGERWEQRDSGTDLRIITEARLLAVNPVAWPAYPESELSVSLRDRGNSPAGESRGAWIGNSYVEGYGHHGDPLAGPDLAFCLGAIAIEMSRLQDAQAYLRALPAGEHAARAQAIVTAAAAALAELIDWLAANGATPSAEGTALAERARAAVAEVRGAPNHSPADHHLTAMADRERRLRLLQLGSRQPQKPSA